MEKEREFCSTFAMLLGVSQRLSITEKCVADLSEIELVENSPRREFWNLWKNFDESDQKVIRTRIER
jgi:hypothetical protein